MIICCDECVAYLNVSGEKRLLDLQDFSHSDGIQKPVELNKSVNHLDE